MLSSEERERLWDLAECECSALTPCNDLRDCDTAKSRLRADHEALAAERDVLAEVFAEMRRARELHGDGYMGNLATIAPFNTTDSTLYQLLSMLEIAARRSCKYDPSRCAVLAEEVAEALKDAIEGKDPREELVQVAAMALAWLGVDPGDAS